jgi:hypothetical protein
MKNKNERKRKSVNKIIQRVINADIEKRKFIKKSETFFYKMDLEPVFF